MAVDRADVAEAERFDEAVADEESLEGVLDLVVRSAERVEAEFFRRALNRLLQAIVVVSLDESP